MLIVYKGGIVHWLFASSLYHNWLLVAVDFLVSWFTWVINSLVQLILAKLQWSTIWKRTDEGLAGCPFVSFLGHLLRKKSDGS